MAPTPASSRAEGGHIDEAIRAERDVQDEERDALHASGRATRSHRQSACVAVPPDVGELEGGSSVDVRRSHAGRAPG